MYGRQLFSGGVFSGRIDGGLGGAEIELCDAGVLAQTRDGQQFLIPYDQCRIEIGGTSGKMVFCRNPDRSVTIFSEDRQFARSLAQASKGLLLEQLEGQHALRRGERRRWRWLVASMVVGFAVVVLGGLWAVRLAARTAVHALPLSVDQKLGAVAFESMDLGGPEIDDPEIEQALQKMVDRLSPQANAGDMTFRIHVVDSPMVNAFALPGGIIVVYTGLIEQASSAEQVAGVLAHEMAHATLRHGLERLADSANVLIAINLLLGDVQGLLALGAKLFTVASINSYSRTQELEADHEGTRMMHAAGIDPQGLAEFLKLLDEQHGHLPAAAAWLSTHPDNVRRIKAIRQHLAELPARQYDPVAVDWAKIRQWRRELIDIFTRSHTIRF